MEEGIDELSSEDEESGEVLLHGGIVEVIIRRSCFEVLLELFGSSYQQSDTTLTEKDLQTLKRFFSSFRDFSFFSRSFVRELL